MKDYKDYNYIELVIGDVKHRNNVITIQEAGKIFSESNRIECYRSFYRYPVAMLEHVRKTGSVRNYDDMVWADVLWIDIDNAKDINMALEDTRRIIEQLIQKYEIPQDLIGIYFTGSKGFNITLPMYLFGLSPDVYLPNKVKHIVKQLTKGIEVDLSVYDKTRIIRIPNTINIKSNVNNIQSNLRKIPLTYNEINELDIKSIKELAKNTRVAPTAKTIDELEGKLSYLLEGYGDININHIKGTPISTTAKQLYGTKLCIHKMLTQGVEQGYRDIACIRLASHFVKSGYPEGMILAMLNEWNGLNQGDSSFTSGDIATKVASAFEGCYDYGCNDPVLSHHCSGECFLSKKKASSIEDIKVWTLEEIEKLYSVNVKDTTKKRIQLQCLPEISKAIRWNTGEVGVILGRTGVGKSNFLQTIAQDVAGRQGIPTLMFSLEMPKELVYERGVSIETGWSPDAIEQFYMDDDAHKLLEFNKQIRKLENFKIIDKAGLTIQQIEDCIINQGNVRFVAVDYMTLVKGEGRTDYERVSFVARKLKEVAKNTDTAILMLVQLSRAGGDGTTKVSMTMARDSGQVEEAADYILSLYRDEEDDRIIISDLLKNRKGKNSKTLSEYMMFLGESVKMVALEKKEN
jgi:KaiC/GvpD/RAD55 family RecA-like ATPase